MNRLENALAKTKIIIQSTEVCVHFDKYFSSVIFYPTFFLIFIKLLNYCNCIKWYFFKLNHNY